MPPTFAEFQKTLGARSRRAPLSAQRAAFNRKFGLGPAPKPPPANPNTYLPLDVIGDDSVIGPYKAPPNVNPSEYEVLPTRDGRYVARPRTELTGLDPQQVADVRDFDARTTAQTSRIDQAYKAFADAARKDADAGAVRLGNLAQSAGAGFQGIPNPTRGRSMAEQQQTANNARAALQSAVAENTTAVSRANRLPTVAGAAGLSALERFSLARQDQRSDVLRSFRESNAELAARAAAARAEQEQFRQTLAAQLRGQDIGLIGQQISGQVDLAQSQITARGKAADRALEARKTAATLRQQAEIARANNQTARAKILSDRANKQAEIAARLEQSRRDKLPSMAAALKEARSLAAGQNLRSATRADVLNGDAGDVGERIADNVYEPLEIYEYMRSQGFTDQQAIQIVRATTDEKRFTPHVPLAFRGGNSLGGLLLSQQNLLR